MEKSDLINNLKKFKEKNKFEKVYLFGSRALGNPNKWSDVDLMIVSKKFNGKRILERSPELYLKWDINYPVDFLCYTPEEFYKLSKKISIVSEVIKECIEI